MTHGAYHPTPNENYDGQSAVKYVSLSGVRANLTHGKVIFQNSEQEGGHQ